MFDVSTELSTALELPATWPWALNNLVVCPDLDALFVVQSHEVWRFRIPRVSREEREEHIPHIIALASDDIITQIKRICLFKNEVVIAVLSDSGLVHLLNAKTLQIETFDNGISTWGIASICSTSPPMLAFSANNHCITILSLNPPENVNEGEQVAEKESGNKNHGRLALRSRGYTQSHHGRVHNISPPENLNGDECDCGIRSCPTYSSRQPPTPDQYFLQDINRGISRMRLVGHRHNIPCIDFSPCGRYLASASIDQTLRVWDLQCPEVSFDEETQASVRNPCAEVNVSASWGWACKWLPPVKTHDGETVQLIVFTNLNQLFLFEWSEQQQLVEKAKVDLLTGLAGDPLNRLSFLDYIPEMGVLLIVHQGCGALFAVSILAKEDKSFQLNLHLHAICSEGILIGMQSFYCPGPSPSIKVFICSQFGELLVFRIILEHPPLTNRRL